MRIVLLVAVTMVAFAANSILNRLAITDQATGPLAFASLRLVSGAAVLGLMVMAQGGPNRLIAGLSLKKAAALAVYMLGFSLAYTALDAGLGALILFGGVQLTMFGGAMIGGERPGAARLIGAAVAFVGLAWLLWPSGEFQVPLGGAALMLAAALGWGWYSLMGRGGGDPLAATAGSFLIASVPVVLAALVLWDGITLPGAALACLSGAVTSGLGYALWYRLLPSLAATTAAVSQLTVAPIAIAGGALMLGEAPDLTFLIATLVILAGVLIAVVPFKR